MQKVWINTKDNVKIAGNYVPGSLPYAVLMLHMMPATKESYAGLASVFLKLGFSTLAIDLRGHGESGGGDYHSFSDKEHQDSIMDIEAAVEFLKAQNPQIRIGFVGASIGSNLSLLYASTNEVAFITALSAGLNYRGVDALEAVRKFQPNVPVFFVASKDDPNVPRNFEMIERLFESCASKNKKIKIFDKGGHGTDIISNQPELAGILTNWARKETYGKNQSV
jgi:alpha-beta hydrolase superfamily lysophospholipase